MNYKKTLVLLICSFCAVLAALDCSQCRKKIKGRYIKDQRGGAYCSDKCFSKIAPKCAVCRKPCIKGSYKFNGKDYCSERCLDRVSKCDSCGKPARPMHTIINQDGDKIKLCTSCSRNPKCYFCALPYRTQQLYDGRHICEKCRKTVRTSKQEMQSALNYIRSVLKKMYNFDNTHHIELVPVSLSELENESKGIYLGAGGGRMALMRHQYDIVEKTDWRGRKTTSIRNERCRIFVLTHTPADLLDDALAHELTHDYLRHNAGKIKDLKIEEGFAEAIAASFNDQIRKSHLNKRKKNNPDPIYGDGYRMMSDMLKRNGFTKTMQFIKSKATPLF